MLGDMNVKNTPEQLDFFEVPLAIPVNKLDADQYAADDIDGMTESIFGSGNMAYASLQASQVDAAAALNEAINMGLDHVPDHESLFLSGGQTAIESTAAGTFSVSHPDHDIPTDTDRALDLSDTAGTENLGAEGGFSHTMVGALGASTLSSDIGSFASLSSLSLGGNSNFDNVTGGNTTTSTTINNVINNVNVDDTVQNIVNTVNETINNITNLGDEIIENILEGDIGEVVNIVNNQVSELTEMISTEINNVTDTVNNILQDFGVTEITNQVTEVTSEITEIVTNTVNEVLDNVLGEGGIAVDLDTGILGTLGTGLHITVDDSIAGNIGTNLVSDNLSALTGDLAGLNIPVVPDTGVNIGFDLLGGGDASDGNDVSVSGISAPVISLDPVENIVGDIDIEFDLPTELSDPDTLVEIVEDLIEHVDDIALVDPEEILDVLGGQGAEGTLDIVAGDTVLDEDFSADADTVIEDLQSSLNVDDDLNIDDAIDMLAPGDGGLADDTGGIAGDSGWTESTIDAGGLFDDIVSGIGGAADALPDPGGTVAEGLGVLNVDPHLDTGGLGGLFG